jgi:glycine dehydrogenase subunit 2
MIEAAELSKTDPDALHSAPLTMPIKRLDETKAARQPNLRWQF